MSASTPASTLPPAVDLARFLTCTPERIRALSGPAAQECVVEVVACTGSTNLDCLTRIASPDGLAPRHLLLAHTQTAGRGRAGRSWLSTPESSLTFSLAWQFRRSMQDLIGLSLAVGVALAEALQHFQIDVALKWPNDVLRGGKKLAGILIETVPAAANSCWAVIGVGLNIQLTEQMASAIGQPAASMGGQPIAREVLMAALLDDLAQAMNLFDEQGFAAFCARWNGLHAWQGQEVKVLDRGVISQRGRVVGVDTVGRLLIDGPSGRVGVIAGDVSLRKLSDDE